MLRKWMNDLGMVLMSLVLAVVIWIVAVREENPIQVGEFPDPIPVEVRNQPPGTTFLPEFDEQVQLTIRAPRTSWEGLRANKFMAWVDLQGLAAGDYDLPVTVTCTDPDVQNIEPKPATVPVYLRENISRTVPVQIRLYGSAALGYEMKTGDETITEPENVTVTGPAPIVDQVSKATVDLYLRDVKETFTGSRRVVARQANDDLVGGFVSIEPPTVQITIPVVQKTGFSEAVVRPVLSGVVASGYWVSNITVDPATVTLVGDPDILSQISGFVETLPLDISGATGDVVERMPLNLPEGASPVGVQGVLVTVEVEAQMESRIISLPPVVRGLSPDLVAKISPSEVTLTLFGPLPRLNTLATENVYVYADVVELGVGLHRVELTYLVPEGIQVISISPAAVDVEITQPTATPRPPPSPTPTPTPTEVVSTTQVITGSQVITISTVITVTVVPTGTTAAPQAVGTPTPTPTPPALTPSPTPAATPTPVAQAAPIDAPALVAQRAARRSSPKPAVAAEGQV